MMECPKCGGARSVCKCLWFSKESLDKALYPEKTLRDKITSLQARVKELEAQVLKYDEFWQKGDHPENARLQKLVDMNQKVVDACRKHTHRSPEIAEALRELDAKKYKVGPNPNYERDRNKRECKCGNYHCPGDC